MNRPRHIWLLFAVCFAVLLAAMGWVSLTTLRLDRAQQEAARQAEVEENVRLALWRLDSLLSPLILEESARPHYFYEPFYATEHAYSKSYASLRAGEVLVPSPLLGFASSNVLLHFQLQPDGRLTSPQAPIGPQRELALASCTTPDNVRGATERLGRLQTLLNQQGLVPDTNGYSSLLPRSFSARPQVERSLNRDVLINQCAVFTTNTAAAVHVPALNAEAAQRQSEVGQQLRSSAEWQARANVSQLAQQQVSAANSLFNNYAEPSAGTASANDNPVAGLFKPTWIGGELLLARRVELPGRFTVQGCWLNWPALRQMLLASVKDLFPAADLQPAPPVNGARESRMLAAIPARLITGPASASTAPAWSPVRQSLLIAWTCVLLAAGAVGVLLHGTLSLSERRGDFVSAVTHELRTPLTTFKMYSEMLAADMVPDAARRRHYLDTLCSEAGRLSHLVENVLAYARLERGSARSRVERVTLGGLIEQVKPRLDQRAGQAGLSLVVDSDETALRTVVHVDVSAVEQILFNLVDNACKYAAPGAGEKLIHLEALPDGKFAMLRVRDHGQGISAEAARRLFQPFSKSAHEAARTAPGVGLGLALCRRLSRSMGGDLRHDALVRNGACFVLLLPLTQAAPA